MVHSDIMARQWSAEKELDDMTECCICTEVFTDPRVLPCIHTFCLNCLLNYGKDKQPGDRMACPMCRKEFTIPGDGLQGTQKNFFVEKLIYVRKLSAAREKAQHLLCEICCSDEEGANKVAKSAAMYCTQCKLRLCLQCSMLHSNMKSSSKHTQLEVGSPESGELISKVGVYLCDQHKSEELKLFCQECETAICMMCFATGHRTHECLDIEKAANDCRPQVLSDTDRAKKYLKKIKEVVSGIPKKKSNFIKHLANVEAEINAAADKLIAAVELDRAKLLSEVEFIKQKGAKQLETTKRELEEHNTTLKSFNRYSEILLNRGTACDLATSANSLHDRADELMTFDVISHVERSRHPANVRFTQLESDDRNRVGSITEEGSFLAKPNYPSIYPCIVRSPKQPFKLKQHIKKQATIQIQIKSYAIILSVTRPKYVNTQPLSRAVLPHNVQVDQYYDS